MEMEMEIKMKISEGREQRGERDIIILTRWRFLRGESKEGREILLF